MENIQIKTLYQENFRVFFNYKKLLYQFTLYTDGYDLKQLSGFIIFPGKGYTAEDNCLGRHIFKEEKIGVRTKDKMWKRLKHTLETLDN